MRKVSISFLLFLFLSFSIHGLKLPESFNEQTISKISFTENKGQVCDQNYLPRPDVLFSGSDSRLVYHIKNKGISYQLLKIESWKTSDETKNIPTIISKTGKSPDKVSIYRIDVDWLNTNPRAQIQTGEPLPGYNNYYLHNCPNGIFNVKSYKEMRLKNLYDGIDLRYYEKNNCLKYDFIVGANKNYKHIQLSIDGAEISLQNDGSLLLKTPFGNVQEGKPIVFQNGKELSAKWVINGNVLSFDITDIDPSSELIIDPPTRIWGTYYGASAADEGLASATDNMGNVLMAGTSAIGTVASIATSGAHQFGYGGGITDGLLVKFNSTGVRLWATYYGGGVEDQLRTVDTDNAGNIYAAGYTTSSSAISTVGSFQFAKSPGIEGFLVKFNSAGIRQWGTYYGSINPDYIYSCKAESSGNVYVAGITVSSSGNYFATAGAHQSTFGGGTADAFIAKFSSTGARIWSTYYGGIGDEEGSSCTCDNKGSVYLSGCTNNGASSIVTPGAHQTVAGGLMDAYLVKFDSSGTRVWGTLYGGSSGDRSGSCINDTTGNVYLIGSSRSTGAGVIATSGSHQSTIGGGIDAFCVKFNSSGIRQWGTFYGGNGNDVGTGCATDLNGNIYFCGQTFSGGSIASAAAHQTTFGGGGDDGFIVKLDGTGVRQWGTYYGGNGADISFDCSVDTLNNLFMTGLSFSTNSVTISTPGSQQPVLAGNKDAFLVKFDGCGAPPQPASITGTASFCGSSGSPQTYSIVPVSGAISYNWNFPSGWSGSSTTNSITLNNIAVSGYLTVSASNTCGAGPASAISVTVYPNPVISVPGGTVCSGNNFTLMPTGASTYTFSSGSAVISPTTTTTYSVTGTSTAGCVSASPATPTITVLSNPTVTVSGPQTITCIAPTTTINASGASSYTWSGVGIISGSTSSVATVNQANTYSVIGSVAGCSSNIGLVNVTMNTTPPSISANTTSSVICGPPFQGTATLTATGANTYTWNPGGTGMSISVSPSVTTQYTITGMNTANGCTNTATFTQSVSLCTDISSPPNEQLEFVIYPNPTSGLLNIQGKKGLQIHVYNIVGELILSTQLKTSTIELDLSTQANGVYFIRIGWVTKKIIKE
jgi:hypothetical protein